MPNLLDTESGRLWLDNFEEQDIETAKMLAESVRLVSTSDVEHGLNERIGEIEKLHQDGSIAMFCIREVDSITPEEAALRFEKRKNGCIIKLIKSLFSREEPTTNSRRFARKVSGRRPRTTVIRGENVQVTDLMLDEQGNLIPGSYFDSDHSVSPTRSRQSVPTGSEASVGTLIRDISNRNGASKWLDHPSIDQMKAQKTRTVILVDDIVGSGTRVKSFLTSFFANTTIKSWFSFKRFKVHVVCWAALDDTLQNLRRNDRVERIHCVLPLERHSSLWSGSDVQLIKDLCQKYAKKTSRPAYALGYKKAFTTICFDYKCPNTTPAILWAGSKNWKPLFNTRPKLDQKNWPTSLTEEQRRKRVLKACRQNALAKSVESNLLTEGDRKMITALGLMSRGMRNPVRLGAALGLSGQQCEQFLSKCRNLNLISANNKLTLQGRSEIARAKRRKVVQRSDKSTRDDYYFPQSLRKPSS